MGEIIMRNWELREFRVWVNWLSPIRQVVVLIRQVIKPIWGLLNLIWQVVLLISHSHLYPPYHFHVHPPSLSFLSTTPPSSQEHKVKLSLSISPCHHHELTLSAAYTECSIHWVQHTPSTAYTEYSIHRVQHTPNTAYTEFSIHRVQYTPSTAYTEYSIHLRLSGVPSFSQFRVDPWMRLQLPAYLPTDRLPPGSCPWELQG